MELHTMTTCSCGLHEVTPERDVLANELAVHVPLPEPPESDPGNGEDATIFEALTAGPKLRKHAEEASDFLNKVKRGYRKDSLFLKSLKIRRNSPYFDIGMDISIPKIKEDKKSSVYLG